MDHIAAVLRRVLQQARLEKGVANYAFFGRWSAVVGPHLATQTRPLCVRGSVLWVYVENSTLQHHLTFLLPKLLERIHQEAPDCSISRIRLTQNPEVGI